jgi:hypothetical protein
LFINLTPLVSCNPIPFFPFPLLRGRGSYFFKRGFASLKLSFGSYHAGEGEEILEKGKYGVPTKMMFLWGENPLSYLP